MARDTFAGTAADPAREVDLLGVLEVPERELLDAAGNRPLLLDDPDALWLVAGGRVDLFAVELAGPQLDGARRHLCRVERCAALFGVDLDPVAHRLRLEARGAPGTRVLKLALPELRALAAEDQMRPAVSGVVERWVLGLAQSLAAEVPPAPDLLLEPGAEYRLPARAIAMPVDGAVWVRLLSGAVRLLGREELSLPADGDLIPATRELWLKAGEDAGVWTAGSCEWLRHDPAWRGLAHFHRLFIRGLLLSFEEAEQAERRRLAEKAEMQRAAAGRAWHELATLLAPDAQAHLALPDGIDPLLAACRLVGDSLGVELRAPPGPPAGGPYPEQVRRIAAASAVRMRVVALRGTWWQEDRGPIVATLESLDRPVALLPASSRSYVLHDPVALTQAPVTAAVAAGLAPFAMTFYRTFPGRAITLWDLVRFGLRGCGRDARTAGAMALLGALLGLAMPLAIRSVFDTIIPEAGRGRLLEIGLALVVVAAARALFEMTRSVALLRIDGRMGSAVQAAVWDRLLNLPAAFFRGYTAGDLGARAASVDAIPATITGPAMHAIRAGISALLTFGLLVYLDVRLALGALILVLVAVTVTLLAGALERRYRRRLMESGGQIAGLVLQLVSGIAKFRAAGVESRAFAVWAHAFARQRKLAYRAATLDNALAAFDAAYPVVTLMALFAMVALSGGTRISIGTFLAFNACFLQFLGAVLDLGAALIALRGMAALYERAAPILRTLPEIDTSRADPGTLTGDIEISHLTFRYKSQGPVVLNDISLRIKPGEFVALVGSSGSGKSTLFRLLLGFETPQSGAIYYDGQELTRIDLRAVRRQIGVVLQNGKLLTGTILENITGATTLTLEDAWEAARMAGLDTDIHQMPMGMHTYLAEGGGTLSGGQRQRLLIARAIAKRPRLVFFDEATSALDNRTQQVVGQSLERLQATRVVIAHRLSTIMHADRIFVLDRGTIVQTGTYAELIEQPGLFAGLARRQLV